MIRITALAIGILAPSTFADVFLVPDQYPTITQAISAAESASTSPHTIIVGPGTYNESLIINQPNLTIQSSDGADSTVIDAADIYYRCVDVNPTATNFILFGFTLQNGYTINNGAGIRSDASNTAVESCTIQDCTAQLSGGAFYGSQSVLLEDCLIQRNTGSAAIYEAATSAVINVNNCTFIDNASRAIYSNQGSLTVTNSDFITSSNSFGFIDFNYPSNGSSHTIQNCTFTGATERAVNWAASDYSELNISECSFNSSQVGVYIRPGRASITNSQFTDCTTGILTSVAPTQGVQISTCTFAKNTGSQGSALDNDDSDAVVLSDSTFCENTVPAILGNYESLGGNIFLSDCDTITGACCLGSSCVALTEVDCGFAGGQFSGFSRDCSTTECVVAPVIGACCVNGNAITLEESDCSLVSGQFFGEGSTPDDVSCESDSSCPEDLDGNGEVGFPDLLEIISAWGPCSG